MNKSYIDVGISVESVDNQCLIGTMKVVSSKPGCKDFRISKNRINFDEAEDDLYNENIQIAELNSLNACLAVIKWKKFLGFYQDKNRTSGVPEEAPEEGWSSPASVHKGRMRRNQTRLSAKCDN